MHEHPTTVVAFQCEHCGKAQSRRVEVGRSPRFCDRACQKAHTASNLVRKACETCGKEVAISPYDAARGLGRYCSTACLNTGRRREGKGRGRPPVERVCLNCDRTFRNFASEVEKGSAKFCGEPCRQEFNRAVSARLWPHGAHVSYGPSWLGARDAARARDSNRCQECGVAASELGRPIHVHHIVPFRRFGTARHAEANRLENLVCLCHECHTKRHPEFRRLVAEVVRQKRQTRPV